MVDGSVVVVADPTFTLRCVQGVEAAKKEPSLASNDQRGPKSPKDQVEQEETRDGL
jgi:hypothetical protein